jgi:hypothetical protein
MNDRHRTTLVTRHPVLFLLALRRRRDDDRIAALVFLLLWAELAAAGGRNDHLPPFMRTGPAAREMRSLRRARRTTAGRRARG